MRREQTRITAEVWGLRARNLAYTAIQLTGFALIFYSVYQILTPYLRLYGYPHSLPGSLAAVLPALAVSDAVIGMFAGIILVWLSTATWF